MTPLPRCSNDDNAAMDTRGLCYACLNPKSKLAGYNLEAPIDDDYTLAPDYDDADFPF